MEINVIPLQGPVKWPVEVNLGFGVHFTNRMFTQNYVEGVGWHDATIGPYEPFVLDPSCAVFHYAQEIFEGAKAYRRPDGRVNLFRLIDNMRRFNHSAWRMAMPPIDENEHFEAIVELIKLEKEWVPHAPGESLYIRPAMIATDNILGVRPSLSYLHFVILSPVASYFKEGFNTIPVYISETYRRAVKGGTGDAKAGGNYAASLLVANEAQKRGYSQVLWLDAITGHYVEEVGAMNICFVYGKNRIVTPPLTGTILAGITRDSLLILAKDLGYDIVEEMLDIDQVLADIKEKKITEVFGCGTAAVIAPVGRLGFRDSDYTIGDGDVGPVATHLYNELTGIQRGEITDRFGWTYTI